MAGSDDYDDKRSYGVTHSGSSDSLELTTPVAGTSANSTNDSNLSSSGIPVVGAKDSMDLIDPSNSPAVSNSDASG